MHLGSLIVEFMKVLNKYLGVSIKCMQIVYWFVFDILHVSVINSDMFRDSNTIGFVA